MTPDKTKAPPQGGADAETCRLGEQERRHHVAEPTAAFPPSEATVAWASGVTATGVRPARRTSCTGSCPDCDRGDEGGLVGCTRSTQFVRRVGYCDLFGEVA